MHPHLSTEQWHAMMAEIAADIRCKQQRRLHAIMVQRIAEERVLRMRTNPEAVRKWETHQAIIDRLLGAKFSDNPAPKGLS